MSPTAFPSELLSQSVTQRLDYFKACTIAHSRLQEVAQELRDAMREPAGELIVFIYGPTGVGKTTVLRRCMQQIIEERREEMENDPSWVPVLGVEAISPERGNFDWRNYYFDALNAFNEPLIRYKIQRPQPENGSGGKMPIQHRLESRSTLRFALETAFRQRRPLAFFVDEAQHLAKLSSGRKLQDQLDCLKSLAVRTNTIHVLSGTYELLILRGLSGQLSRRTRQIHFARYQADSAGDQRDFKNVLWNFQIRMPLKSEPDLMSHWEFCYERSLGCIGLLKDWLTRTLAMGLSEKKPHITIKHLEKQALSLFDCQKIATEILEGEAALVESERTRIHLRALLGLEDVKCRSAEEIGATDQQPDAPTNRSRQPRRVGERNPRRDSVGTPRAADS
jgi:energy-coupling factor transporter ATP-binding protein EcfA2